MFASSSVSKLSSPFVHAFKHSFSFLFMCHLWCLLNENNHRNSTVASTSPLRLLYTLILHPSIHLDISALGHGMMGTACAECSDWLDHVFCWQTRTCTAAMCEGMLSPSVCASALPKTKKKLLFLADLLADSLNPLAEWTITCRKPYRPGVSSSGKQAHRAVSPVPSVNMVTYCI